MRSHATVLTLSVVASFIGLPVATSCNSQVSRDIEFSLVATPEVPQGDFQVDGFGVRLEEAQLAFGPLSLCAGFSAGENCGEAVAEYFDAAAIDLLNPERQILGTVRGTNDQVQSYMYDLGFTSVLTQERPLPWPVTNRLDGHSVVVRGVLLQNSQEVDFDLRLVMSRPNASEESSVTQGVALVRKSLSQEPLAQGLDERVSALRLVFAVESFFETVDLSFVNPQESCAAEREFVCAGANQVACDDSGLPVETLPCDHACINGQCVQSIDFSNHPAALSQFSFSIKQSGKPTFVFEEAEEKSVDAP